MKRIDLLKIEMYYDDIEIESVADTVYINGYDEISRYIVKHQLTSKDFTKNNKTIYKIVDNGFMYLLDDIKDIIQEAYEAE